VTAEVDLPGIKVKRATGRSEWIVAAE